MDMKIYVDRLIRAAAEDPSAEWTTAYATLAIAYMMREQLAEEE